MKNLKIEIGNEVVIKDQQANERFIVSDFRGNGYATLLLYKLKQDGTVSKQGAKRLIIPIDDVIGIQITMRF